MWKANYNRYDGIIGEKQLQKIDKEIAKSVDIVLKDLGYKTNDDGHPKREGEDYPRAVEIMKDVRRYILGELLEMWGGWSDKGDCLPQGTQLGKNSNKYLYLEVRELKTDEVY